MLMCRTLPLSIACFVLAACAEQPPEPVVTPYASWPEPLALLPHGPEQTAAVCERSGDDLVRDAFCGAERSDITSMSELHAALGLDLSTLGGISGVSVTGHSTSLSARSVSAINPRVVVVQLESPPAELLAVAFARGEQFSEIVVRDRKDGELRFYLVGFRQACNDDDLGCTPGDLLTPAVERDWREVTLFAEPDLANTVLDCAPCHQPNGPDTPKMIRMQELETPWTHWFFRSNEGGRALLADYFAARGDEPYAAMSADQIDNTHPGNLAMLAIFSGADEQPNQFESQLIEDEVRTSAAELGGAQPIDNSVPGESPTWHALYKSAQRGDAIAVPYHDVKVTDPDKLALMTAAYQAYRSGELPREELPDIRDVYPDDPERLAAMGMMTEPGADGETVLLQACSQCHNARLDQRLSRANFRADLEGMSRAAKNAAIERLKLPASDPRAMPPALLRTLTPEARQRAIEALQR
jgi:mono/diheme cytochrome c family protein